MNLQPKLGSRGPHHCCKIASILQHAGCKLQVTESLKGKLVALKAHRCLSLLLPNCQRTIADNVKHSREGAQITKEKCLCQKSLLYAEAALLPAFVCLSPCRRAATLRILGDVEAQRVSVESFLANASGFQQ
jgi:hypothetical protein